MNMHSIDQQAPFLPFFAREHQDEGYGPVQRWDEQSPSSSFHHIQVGAADTDPADTHPAPTYHAETRFLEECQACGYDSNISGPEPFPFDHTQSQSIAARRTPSTALSAVLESDQSDVSTAFAPVHQTSFFSDENTGFTPTTTKFQCNAHISLSQSLGIEGCIGIIGGFAAILGVFGFLIFLWFGYGSAPEAAKATWVWRQLAIRDWMPQAVTLASLVLRFVIGIQATVCTSMLAALLLERHCVPRSRVAHVSVMRGKIYHLALEAWLIILVALMSLAFQFTSTILLSDMHSFSIIGDSATTTFHSLFSFPGLDRFTLLLQANLMGSKVDYPVFGEVPTRHDSSPDGRGFSDTGLTQRGLLPMSSSEARVSVREYDGMGMVMSSRVSCMRPIISNASVLVNSRNPDPDLGKLQGILDYNRSLQGARPSTGPLCKSSRQCEEAAFECEIQATYSSEIGAGGGCLIGGVGGEIRGAWLPPWDPTAAPWSEKSSIWLVYSSSMGTAEWGSLPSYLPLSLPSTDSEWAIYEIVPGFSIKIAICFSAFNFAYRDILMTAAGKTREWSKSWSMILDKESNTDEAEAYLGLDLSRQAVADRGILELQIKTDTPYTPRRLSYEGLTSLPAGKVSPDELTASALEREMTSVLGSEEDGNITISLCRFCSVPSDGTVVNEEYNSLFSNLVFGDSRRAGRAADALHAFLSVVGLNIYYQFLSDTMDVAEQVGLATTRMVTVPGSWPPSISHYAGLIVVAILLAAYLTIVLVITMLYVRYTRYSRYANIWHVISQLTYAEELKDTLELGNNAGDDAVIDSLRRGLLEDEVLVKLGKADGCGKIKVKRI